jgi:hypothetical protein
MVYVLSRRNNFYEKRGIVKGFAVACSKACKVLLTALIFRPIRHDGITAPFHFG